MEFLPTIETGQAVYLSTLVAVAGWFYTNRKERNLFRKQHTFNALMQASFDTSYQRAITSVRPHIRKGVLPDISVDDEHLIAAPETLDTDIRQTRELREHVAFLLNHYEFLAAGIRNGDIDEKLLYDSERSTILKIQDISEPFVDSLRDRRKRVSIFEHLEWLTDRWGEKPPSQWQYFCEFICGKPIYNKHNAYYFASVAGVIIFILSIYLIH
jgi:hypothetical protein